jgi:hypothetical protein
MAYFLVYVTYSGVKLKLQKHTFKYIFSWKTETGKFKEKRTVRSHRIRSLSTTM